MRRDTDLTILYSGDEVDYRKKECGLNLIDQLMGSVESVREAWSRDIGIVFAHTSPISPETFRSLSDFGVTTICIGPPMEASFLLANKIKAGLQSGITGDILFLDCDTKVHRAPKLDRASDMLVAFDVVQEMSQYDYIEFLDYLGIIPPQAPTFRCPAFQYYMYDRVDMFPNFNSGVFFVKAPWVNRFFSEWSRMFGASYARFRDREWAFYLEQMSFSAAIQKLRIPYQILPKGVNFICTSLAPDLVKWPYSEISIEHYAGNFARPLVFREGFIDAAASGIDLGADG